MPNRRTALKAVGVLAVVLGAVLLFRRAGNPFAHLDELSAPAVVAALLAVLGGLFTNLMTWRALLTDLGSPLPLRPALRVFYLGQLGKYLPGSIWPVLAQMELGKKHGVPRSRSGTTGLLTVALSLVAGLLTGAVLLPFTSPDALHHYWYALLAVPVIGVGLLPAVANPVLDRLLRLARRGGLEQGLSGRGMGEAFGWSVLCWLLFGLQVFALVEALGPSGDRSGLAVLALCIGAFAFAWTAGFLVVIAPAGATVREAVLVVALAPVLGPEEALLVAVVSRGLMTLGDLAWALVAVVASRGMRHDDDEVPYSAGHG